MKKYRIITYGCQMNKADSERIAAALEKKGHKPALKEDEADLIVINMCSVRQSAVDRVHGRIKSLNALKKNKPKLKIILTGCILKENKKKFRKVFDQIWDNKNYFHLPPKRQKKLTALIPISNGCNNFCSYCVVPFTRGALTCRNHKEILKETKKAIRSGFKEIWLLGQNVNDYQLPSFAELVKMVNDIPGEFKFFFVSPHPKNFCRELINALAQCEKFGKKLNLPVQSGDNGILKRMNRPYTVKQYKNLIKRIRKEIPEIYLSTDVIVGFPGETRKQFENTVKLFKEMNFDMAYIAKYSPRPNTDAAKMKDNVPKKEKEKRWKILNNIILKKIKERQRKKLIAVLGPTASGKSELAVKMAKKFNGEVVSADSRQVYKGMSIGTGKVTKKEMRKIPHYLLDVGSPKKRFSVARYKELALQAMDKVQRKNKIPILCGGTGFYIQAVIDGITIPEVSPDWSLRKKLEKKTAKELYRILKNLDPKRAKNIDKNNPRRLIRAIEIAEKTKKPIPPLQKNPLPYPVLMLGIAKDKDGLKKLIKKRLLKRLEKEKMVDEVKSLKKTGLSWKRLEEFGLEYRYIARYLQGKLEYSEMVNLLQKEIEHYADRQMTWFKKDKRIIWIKNYKQAEKQIKDFLENKKGEL